MQTVSIFSIILVIGLGTFALRLSLIQLFERIEIPVLLKRSLRFIPAAVLAALVLPAILYSDGVLLFSIKNERLLAAIVAAFISWRTKNILWTILTGMGTLWLLQLL